MDAMTDMLTDYALSTSYARLPPSLVHETKRHLIDTLACALGAYDEPFCAKLRTFAARYRGEPAATIWGGAQPVSAEMAAFANGVMLRYLDLNDMYRVKCGGHPSDIIAGIVAAGEAVQASGADVIDAINVGYEIYCGFCETIDFNTLGWDQPVYGVVATAAACGKLFGLDREAMGNALALALVPNMTMIQTRTGELSGWKGCAGANACRNGLFAALLARDGFDGPTAAFEGKSGLFDIVGRFAWPGFGGATQPYRLPLSHMKRFPVCYHGQGAAQIGAAFHREIDFRRVRGIHIETYRVAVEMMCNDPTRWAPGSRETADHSLPYVAATALVDGDVTSASFVDERLRDARIAKLMAVTTVKEDPRLTAKHPECAPTRVRITLDDGAEHVKEVDYAAGHAQSPLSDQEVEAKFRGMFALHGSRAHCDELLAALWAFERADDVVEIVKLCARAG